MTKTRELENYFARLLQGHRRTLDPVNNQGYKGPGFFVDRVEHGFYRAIEDPWTLTQPRDMKDQAFCWTFGTRTNEAED